MAAHTSYKTIAHRLETNSIPEPNSGCIIWFGYAGKFGYGRMKVGNKFKPVHRLAYELEKGPVSSGLVLDHKCRVICCINPDHLEPVTQSENIKRGRLPELVAERNKKSRKTHCKRGHPRTLENLYGRSCRQCVLEWHHRKWHGA